MVKTFNIMYEYYSIQANRNAWNKIEIYKFANKKNNVVIDKCCYIFPDIW